MHLQQMLVCMYLFTTLPHPQGHWQLQELLGNQCHHQNLLFENNLPISVGVNVISQVGQAQAQSCSCAKHAAHERLR